MIDSTTSLPFQAPDAPITSDAPATLTACPAPDPSSPQCCMPHEFTKDLRGQPIVKLRTGQGDTVILDQFDFDRLHAAGVTTHNWYRHRDAKGSDRFYIATEIQQATCMVHRLILGVGKGDRVFFLSGNRLDLRRSNLRIMSRVNLTDLATPVRGREQRR